ncbi:meiosis regulator and mRNA stability factor 1-like protein [Brevipalpus obovatus]|uniref:meiosis regulator and mRNA stability factor 1-like protein n=1 Tax=Brevipalpus obovatus TaxID=246614 RepID=UPI003D9F008F
MGFWKPLALTSQDIGTEFSGQRYKVIVSESRKFSNCPLHPRTNYHNHDQHEWVDDDDTLCLPSVNIGLRALAPRLHALLDSHSGCLPLSNLMHCYESHFNECFDTTEGSTTVPLEHLISCIPGIEITYFSDMSCKYLRWSANKLDQEPISQQIENDGNSSDESRAKLLQQFGREVRDLLKSQPLSIILFSKFVPAYHNHFGRQCCVYQYGFTKLIELLEAIPNVVQIMGCGTRRTLTLTHREQTKRFASDLIRVLKAQVNKRITLVQFPILYEKVLNKPFHIQNYGICCITDIMSDVWEGTVSITYPEDNSNVDDIRVEIPRKERTAEEKERTKYLLKDILKLLQSTPSFSLPFSKFIPTFHHYFNRQCKVSDYGFSKLIELFESLCPEIIELEDNKANDEKIIKLSKEQRIKTLASRITRIVRNQPGAFVSLDRLAQLYQIQFNCSINPRVCGAENLIHLLSLLPNVFRLISGPSQIVVTLVEKRLKTRSHHQRILKAPSNDLPRPPENWLFSESTKQSEEVKPRKKMRPRRIVANFNAQTDF